MKAIIRTRSGREYPVESDNLDFPTLCGACAAPDNVLCVELEGKPVALMAREVEAVTLVEQSQILTPSQNQVRSLIQRP